MAWDFGGNGMTGTCLTAGHTKATGAPGGIYSAGVYWCTGDTTGWIASSPSLLVGLRSSCDQTRGKCQRPVLHKPLKTVLGGQQKPWKQS